MASGRLLGEWISIVPAGMGWILACFPDLHNFLDKHTGNCIQFNARVANDWAVETMGNPRYPLELLLRVVTVSIETIKIVRGLELIN